MQTINTALVQRLSSNNRTAGPTCMIRVLGRQTMPQTKFNAEMDMTHRRVEYLLPVDFIYKTPNIHNPQNHDNNHPSVSDKNQPAHSVTTTMEHLSRKDFFYALPTFTESQSVSDGASGLHPNNHNNNHNHPKEGPHAEQPCCPLQQKRKPTTETLNYLLHLKKKMQSLTTHIVALDVTNHSAGKDIQYAKTIPIQTWKTTPTETRPSCHGSPTKGKRG